MLCTIGAHARAPRCTRRESCFFVLMTHRRHTTELIVSCRQGVCVYVRTFTLLITHAITDTKVMLSEPDVGYLYTPLRVDHAMG